MLTLRRILVPNDHGPTTARAYPEALRLAERFGAEVHLVQADVPIDWVHDEASVALPEPPPSVVVETATVQGDGVAEALLDYAEAQDVDLIVMGTHGQRGLTRVFLGSTAERVVREARCPVLTVRAYADGSPAATRSQPVVVRRILAPIDFSDRSEEALHYAFELAAVYEAVVDVLHVVNVPTVPDVYGMDLTWDAARPELVEQSREALERIVIRAAGRECLGETLVVADVPAAAILDAAVRLKTDIVVMGTHGLTGLKRFALGSVTERVIRRSPCPVFTVKSYGKSLLTPPVTAHAAEALGADMD